MLVLYGSGRNGKSVFFNVLQALIGVKNILTYSLGLFNHEYHRAKLTNVLLNYSSEKGTDLNVETFKALISGEPQQAREPYGRSFTLRNKVRFIMNANELPRETEQTNAYFERYLIVPFDTYIKPEDRDSELARKIIANELPGVFNWLLGGLNRIIKQGKFSDCSKANAALGEFRKQSDSVQLFIEEHNYQSSDIYKVALTELYGYYKTFCGEDGYKPVGKNKFSQRLERKGFEKTRRNDGYHFNMTKNVF
jgi:putative DNA primase/helicase